MHADAFKTYAHGCVVQMIFKSYVGRPSGAARRRGETEGRPVLTVAEITEEMDACFDELGYKAGECPFTHGWREDGVPSAMVIHFCKRQGERGKPLRCAIFHREQKIAEISSDNATDQSPYMLFSIFNDHAYYYANGKQISAMKNLRETAEDTSTRKFDEYSNIKIRDPFPKTARPPFTEWKDEFDLMRLVREGFLNRPPRVDGSPRARSNSTSTRSSTLTAPWSASWRCSRHLRVRHSVFPSSASTATTRRSWRASS